MNEPLSPPVALFRLLAGALDPEGLPPAESIPWPEVLGLAETHDLGGPLYAVTRALRLSPPPEVARALEAAALRVAAENARCMHQLAQVREALAALGVPVLLLKGAALTETLYGEGAARRIGDIDLVVPQEGVPACRQALLDLGYTSSDVEHRPGAQEGFRNEQVFRPPAPFPAWVDLHWHLLDAPYYLRHVPVDWFWEHSQTLWLGGLPYKVLDAEANLVYLPAHLALHHRFRPLHSFLDLALLVEQNRDRLDWGLIGAAARSFGVLSALRATLDRLTQLWPSLPLGEPRRLLGALAPSRRDGRLFRLLTAESRTVTLDFYTTLVSLPDLRSRARYAWFNLFPQPAYMRARYPVRAGWHLPFWYLVRLSGGLTRFAAMLPRARRIDRGPGR